MKPDPLNPRPFKELRGHRMGCVCQRVCERERDRVCVCVRERERV